MAGGPGPVTNRHSRRAFTPRRDSPTDRRDGRRLSPGMRPGRVRPQRTTARIAQPAPVSHGLDGLRRHNTTGMPPPSRRATWPADHRRRPAPRHDRHDLEAMDGLRCHTRQACCPTTGTPTPRRDRRGSQATDASAATARGMAEWTGVRHDDTTGMVHRVASGCRRALGVRLGAGPRRFAFMPGTRIVPKPDRDHRGGLGATIGRLVERSRGPFPVPRQHSTSSRWAAAKGGTANSGRHAAS